MYKWAIQCDIVVKATSTVDHTKLILEIITTLGLPSEEA